MENNNGKLTPHQEGSVKELIHISLPLMISSLASLFMIFIDRCFLARHSLDALNASVNAGTLAWAFIGSFGMLTAMSEIFVAQYNGAKHVSKLGSPVWQMVWLSIFSAALFIPLGLWISPLIYTSSVYSQLQIDYFSILVATGFLYPLMTALAGFFIGQGNTRLLIYLGIIANILNALFDWLFIFGLDPIIPAMGIKGAAWATVIGSSFQVAVLGYLFFKKKNRENHGATLWKIKPKLMLSCIRIGSPPAIFYALEIAGWAYFFQMMSSIGEMHITISSICQSVIILLSFFFDGLSRGVAALAGNFIGSKKHDLVKKLLKSGVKLQVAFTLIVASVILFDPKFIIDFMLPGKIEEYILQWKVVSGHSFNEVLKISLFCVFFYLFFEGVRWILAGILTAAGDTFFLLVAGSLSVWLFLLLPVYLIVVKFSLTVQVAWILAAVYAALLCLVYWIRYRKGHWKNISLFSDKEILETEKTLED